MKFDVISFGLCFLIWELVVIWRCLFQGGEDEEEAAEHFSEEEVSHPAVEPEPAADAPTEELVEQGEEEERDGGGKEDKSEEKGTLAGERQSGDGQVWRNRTLHLSLLYISGRPRVQFGTNV